MSLPALAESVRVKATLAGHSLYLHTGEYSDGRLGEVFVTMGGQGGDLGAWIGAWAQSVSVALQHGTPFSALARSFLGHTANPSGFVQGLRDIPTLAHIRTASSPMDLIFQLLSAFYDDNGMRRDCRPSPDNKPHNDASDNDKPEASDKPARVVTSPTASIGKPKGGGDLCPNCNSFGLRRSGTCQVCEVCHTTTGCS
jgi:ribonucleoside-diphosphate reductase alpha chain